MKRYIQAAVAVVLAALLLWLLFRDTNWSEVFRSIREIDLFWLAAVHVPLLMTFPLRVKRWSYIVRASDPVSFRTMFSATQIGFLANFTLFGRVGEAVRALVLTRLTDIKFSKSLAMVALDRVADLMALMVVLLVTLAAYRPEETVVIPPETFGTAEPIAFTATQYNALSLAASLFLAFVLTCFVLLYTNRALVVRLSEKIIGIVSKRIGTYIAGAVDHFAHGLHIFRSPFDMAKALVYSLLTWLGGILAIQCMLYAFDIQGPWYTAVFMQALLSIFVAAPNTPGFVGQFHVPIVITLVMLVPDINVDKAKAYAIVMHLAQLPPVIALGVYFLVTDHMGLLQLSREGEELAEQVESQREEV